MNYTDSSTDPYCTHHPSEQDIHLFREGTQVRFSRKLGCDLNATGFTLDWVPLHFPADAHSSAVFDGTHLYEHADPQQGFHCEWNLSIFKYGRNDVRAFLLSSAMFWLDEHHIDGLRVEAVASMLYLDHSRKEGEWIPNRFGGRENREAVSFLRRLGLDCFNRGEPAQ